LELLAVLVRFAFLQLLVKPRSETETRRGKGHVMSKDRMTFLDENDPNPHPHPHLRPNPTLTLPNPRKERGGLGLGLGGRRAE
jgi:hypothetical protein